MGGAWGPGQGGAHEPRGLRGFIVTSQRPSPPNPETGLGACVLPATTHPRKARRPQRRSRGGPSLPRGLPAAGTWGAGRGRRRGKRRPMPGVAEATVFPSGGWRAVCGVRKRRKRVRLRERSSATELRVFTFCALKGEKKEKSLTGICSLKCQS